MPYLCAFYESAEMHIYMLDERMLACYAESASEMRAQKRAARYQREALRREGATMYTEYGYTVDGVECIRKVNPIGHFFLFRKVART